MQAKSTKQLLGGRRTVMQMIQGELKAARKSEVTQ